jgi:hypothetical protein
VFYAIFLYIAKPIAGELVKYGNTAGNRVRRRDDFAVLAAESKHSYDEAILAALAVCSLVGAVIYERVECRFDQAESF